jgi:lipopolysaccharide transport system ATP-binding protein
MDHTKRLLQRNATIMVVSHNMFAVRSMCDRSIYLDQGRITHDGPTEDIVRVYEREGRLDMLQWAGGEVGSDPTRCPVYVKHIELGDAHGRPCALFRLGDRLRLRLHYEVNEPVRDPSFGIGIIRSDGVACCHYSSHLDGFRTGTLEEGGVLELLTPPLKLISDTYTIHLLIRDSRSDRLLCAQAAKTFHVRDAVLSTEYGVFHEAGQWSRDVAANPAHGACGGTDPCSR